MIELSKYMGWSGWHFFHFGKPVLGMLHLILSFIGIVGAASCFFILRFADEPGFLLKIALYLIPAIFISTLSGILNSLYWSVHSDDDFRAAYPKKNKTEK